MNGYGGGVESGEKPVEAAVRELKEETHRDEDKGIEAQVEDLEKIAIVDFHNTKSDSKTFVCRVHFYLVKKWQGELGETDEMIEPDWYDIDNLPLDRMMPADRYFLPPALHGEKITAAAKLGPFQKELLDKVKIKKSKIFSKRTKLTLIGWFF